MSKTVKLAIRDFYNQLEIPFIGYKTLKCQNWFFIFHREKIRVFYEGNNTFMATYFGMYINLIGVIFLTENKKHF